MADHTDLLEHAAREWLELRGLKPLEICESEGRWYPDSGTNPSYFGRLQQEYCLLPHDVYEALEFPQPQGWEGRRYPWFPSLVAAVEAAVKAIIKVRPKEL